MNNECLWCVVSTVKLNRINLLSNNLVSSIRALKLSKNRNEDVALALTSLWVNVSSKKSCSLLVELREHDNGDATLHVFKRNNCHWVAVFSGALHNVGNHARKADRFTFWHLELLRHSAIRKLNLYILFNLCKSIISTFSKGVLIRTKWMIRDINT